ncbi:hypothetical protein VTP01DRAFT_3106 [Rhizomucor pusillus]|uniref:uncharacterized protein n=1 Tax=Rhizomucor pusillus TaxID=4840 RepID=UPI0037425CE1
MPVELFGDLSVKFFKRIDEHQGEPVSVIGLMERLTLDALARGLFAVDFHALDDINSPYSNAYLNIKDSLRDLFLILFPQLDFLVKHISSKRARLTRDVDALSNLLLDVAKKRRQEIQERRAQGIVVPDNQKDLLTRIMEAELDGIDGMSSDEDLRGNLAVFFLAGHETTANALSFAIYHLARYADVQEKARKQVIEVLGDEKRDVFPTAEQLKEMKYIDMIIKENLRLLGPADFLNARYTLEDFNAGDLFIPKGTLVSIDLSAIQLNPDLWDKPNDFIPERFEEGAEADQQKGLAWLPFSNGGRQCIGMNFSLAEQRVLLAMLLRKYEWTLPEDSAHKDGVKLGSFLNVAPQNLTIVFKNRY